MGENERPQKKNPKTDLKMIGNVVNRFGNTRRLLYEPSIFLEIFIIFLNFSLKKKIQKMLDFPGIFGGFWPLFWFLAGLYLLANLYWDPETGGGPIWYPLGPTHVHFWHPWPH